MGTPLPLDATGAPASRIVAGFSVLASKSAVLRMATGTVPTAPRLMVFGKLPGLTSTPTASYGRKGAAHMQTDVTSFRDTWVRLGDQ